MIKKLKIKEAIKHVVKDRQTIKKEEQGEEDKDDQSQEYESGEEFEDEDEERLPFLEAL
jgi:hypothetical protein